MDDAGKPQGAKRGRSEERETIRNKHYGSYAIKNRRAVNDNDRVTAFKNVV
jgi:hypothetical protein